MLYKGLHWNELCTGTPSRSTASFQLYFKHVLDVKWSLRPITKNSRKGLGKFYQKRNAIDLERGNDQGRGTEKWWSRKQDPVKVVLFLYILPYQPRVSAGICEMQQHKLKRIDFYKINIYFSENLLQLLKVSLFNKNNLRQHRLITVVRQLPCLPVWQDRSLWDTLKACPLEKPSLNTPQYLPGLGRGCIITSKWISPIL